MCLTLNEGMIMATNSDTIDVHNFFFPGQEILNPENFVGRKQNIAQAINALCRPGTSILVFGERGVGKTSFVEMIKLIAMGQVELIYRYDLHRLAPQEAMNYNIISVECDEDVDSVEKVLQRLVSSPKGISGLIGPRVERIEATSKNAVGLSLFRKSLSINDSEEEKLIKENFKEMSIYETFTNLINFIESEVIRPDEGLLIVIDEFDRVQDSSKLSSLIKTLSKNKVKFLVSGIANDYFQLLSGHQSIVRQLFQGKIKIDPMSDEEIEELFVLYSSQSRGMVDFKKSLKDDIKKKSYGFPYYVQLFGQLALDNYVSVYGNERRGVIAKEHLSQGLKEFAQHEPTLEKLYLSIIGNDPKRELLLKALSIQLPLRITQADAFRYCEKRGVNIQHTMLAAFLALRDPRVLERVNKEKVSFVDPVFKIYAGMREPELIAKNDDGYIIQ
jgi:F0F1-type ATP synthase delta subunit